MRRRTSIIWTTPLENFKVIVLSSNTIKEVLNHFGLQNRGNNFRTFKQRLQEENIDISHFKREYKNKFLEKNLEDILITNSNYSSNYGLKKKLIEKDLIKEICSSCGLIPFWNGKDLKLQLEHINGIRNDNRIENLTFLCPNCHSQTDTFAGKNKKQIYYNENNKPINQIPVIKRLCQHCNQELKCNKSKMCVNCLNFKKRKVERPDIETVKKQISEIGYSATGRLYGVSDNAIRKWVKGLLKF